MEEIRKDLPLFSLDPHAFQTLLKVPLMHTTFVCMINMLLIIFGPMIPSIESYLLSSGSDQCITH